MELMDGGTHPLQDTDRCPPSRQTFLAMSGRQDSPSVRSAWPHGRGTDLVPGSADKGPWCAEHVERAGAGDVDDELGVRAGARGARGSLASRGSRSSRSFLVGHRVGHSVGHVQFGTWVSARVTRAGSSWVKSQRTPDLTHSSDLGVPTCRGEVADPWLVSRLERYEGLVRISARERSGLLLLTPPPCRRTGRSATDAPRSQHPSGQTGSSGRGSPLRPCAGRWCSRRQGGGRARPGPRPAPIARIP